MLKKQNGITLVALVVTVIVLIILAAVTITLVLGENGIIRRTQEGGANYSAAAEDENLQLQNASDWVNEYINSLP